MCQKRILDGFTQFARSHSHKSEHDFFLVFTGDEPETAEKDEETTETPDDTTTAQSQPAQLESQPVQTTQSPDRAGESQETCSGDVNGTQDSVVVSAETDQDGEEQSGKEQVGERLSESGRDNSVNSVVGGDSAETAEKKPSSEDSHQPKTELEDSGVFVKPDPQSEKSQEQAGEPSTESGPEPPSAPDSAQPAGSGTTENVEPAASETAASVQVEGDHSSGLRDSGDGSGLVTERSEASAVPDSPEAVVESGTAESEAAHGVVAQDSSDPRAREAAEKASDTAQDSLPRPVSAEAEVSPEPVSDTKEPEPDKPERLQTEPVAYEGNAESAEATPSEDCEAAQLKSEDTEEVETSLLPAEHSTESPEDSTERNGAETGFKDGKDNRDHDAVPGTPVKPSADSQAAHSDLAEDTAPAGSSEATPAPVDEGRKQVSEGSHTAGQQAEDSRDPEAEVPQEQRSQLAADFEPGELQQVSSLIVQESLAKAFKVLSEDYVSPSEGTQLAESEATEPGVEDSAKPAEPPQTAASEQQDAAKGLEGSAEGDQSLDPPGPLEPVDTVGEEVAATSQAAPGETPGSDADTFSSLSSASSESLRRADKREESTQQRPEGKASSDLDNSSAVEPEFSVDYNHLQQTRTSDTDRDKPGDSADSTPEAEKQTESTASDFTVQGTVQREGRDTDNDKHGDTVDPAADADTRTESSALSSTQETAQREETDEPPPRPLPTHTKSFSGSSSSSLSSAGPADASVAGRRKRGRPRTGSAERKVTFRSPEPRSADTMGSGASRDGEMEEVDPRYAAQSTAAMSHAGSPPRSPVRSKQPMMGHQSSVKSSGHMSMARASRFNMGKLEEGWGMGGGWVERES